MAIERPEIINETYRTPAHVSQWIHWKNDRTPFLFMNPHKLPRVVDFFPEITSEKVVSGYRQGNRLILVTEFDSIQESGVETCDAVFEYEISDDGPFFFTLLNKSTPMDFFPHLKALEEENKWPLRKILVTAFVSEAHPRDHRIIVRSLHCSTEDKNSSIIVETRLFGDKHVESMTKLSSTQFNSSSNLPEKQSKQLNLPIDSMTYLEHEKTAPHDETFIVSVNGFWSRVKVDQDAALINFPTQDSIEARNEVMLSNAFFGCPVSLCFRGEIDAITDIDEGVALFKNQHFWILKTLGPFSKLSSPRLITSKWRSFVGFLDAALNIAVKKGERRLLFFRGNKVHYCHLTGDCYRTFLISYAFPGMQSVDAAYGDEDTNQVFLIKDRKIIGYESIIEGYPAKRISAPKSALSVWRNVPEHIDDAYWMEGRVFLFSQGFFIESNETMEPVHSPYNLYYCDTNYTSEQGWKIISVENRKDFEELRNQSRPRMLTKEDEEEEDDLLAETSVSNSLFWWTAFGFCAFMVLMVVFLVRSKMQELESSPEDTLALADSRFNSLRSTRSAKSTQSRVSRF